MNIIHKTERTFFTLFGEGTSREIKIEYIPGYEESEYFHKIYEPQKAFHTLETKKQYWGTKDRRVCRFCKRDSTSTTFKMFAHIIPEFMSNRILVSNFECDECNIIFSDFETSFCNYMGIFQTLSRVKGRNGVPQYLSNDKQTKIYSDKDSHINIELHDVHTLDREATESKTFDDLYEAQDNVKIDFEKEKMIFKTVKRPYTPVKVLKTLVKIGLCFLDDADLKNYEQARLWLLDNENVIGQHPFFYVYKAISKYNLPKPLVVLYKRKNDFASHPIPEHSLLIFYGMFRFQIFMPLNVNDNWLFENKRMHLPLVEQVVKVVNKHGIYSDCEVEFFDLSSTQEVIKEKEHFAVPFKGKRVNPDGK